MKRPSLLRYSLRTMLVVVLVLSVWLGWTVRVAEQRRAVEAILEAGGQVAYDYEYRDSYGFTFGFVSGRSFHGSALDKEPDASAPCPRWLQDLLGVDAFADVVAVAFGDEATDNTLDQVRHLPRVRHLVVLCANVTEEGLLNLRQLPHLEELMIRAVPVSDSTVERLEESIPVVDVELSDIASSFRGYKYYLIDPVEISRRTP